MLRSVVAAISLLWCSASLAQPPAIQVEVRGQGPPVILVPGLGCTPLVYQDLAATLCRDHECHLVTLAGFGGLPAIGAPFLPRVRDAIVAHIRARKLARPALVGHSLGAFVALWVAATEPGCVGPVVAIDGAPFWPALMDPAATAAKMRERAAPLRSMLMLQPKAAFAAHTRAALETMMRRPEDVARMAKDAERASQAAVAEAVYEMTVTDLRPLLPRIESRGRFLAAAPGSGDPAPVRPPYEAQAVGIRRHEVVLAERANHFVMLDDPAFTRAQIERHLARGDQ